VTEQQASHWVHDLDPVIFSFTETLAIRWYGLAYVAGFLVAFALLHIYWKRGRSPLAPPDLEQLGLGLVLGVMIGGRLGYFLLYQAAEFFRDPLIFFRVWEGGMASHGGFAGVTIAVLLYARKRKVPALLLGDLLATVSAAGLFFGRIANFINGELWGKVSTVPWAVIFPASAPPGTPVHYIAARHPSQLYEAVTEGLLIFIYMQVRFWRLPKELLATHPGRLCGEFLVLYSLGRFLGELFREPDAGLILGLSRGSFYSFFLLAFGAFLIARTLGGRLTSRQS
jgi:phosphatidylglycerol:prolipoprotein diacylglycerol transferase